MDFDAGTGEFIPQLEINFKIPLKKSTEKDTINANGSEEKFHSPLAGQDSYQNEDSMISHHNSSAYTSNMPFFQQSEEVRISLKRKESSLPSPFNPLVKESFSPELTKLMLPLSCELCNVKMNSTLSARSHYESKQHDKKINAWLLEWSKKNFEPMPKRERKADGPCGPNAFHCDVCDLPLTSKQHASQHYMGKKHRMVLAGRTQPTGSGYYGPDGKWIRTNLKTTLDPSGRFHIGQAFEKITNPDAPSKSQSNVDTDVPKIYCKICNVSVTSVSQMKLHLEGTKHAKKLKALGAPPHTSEADTILDSLDKSPDGNSCNRDNSIYRTPSGSYYCKPCNVTILTEPLFIQHMCSKKHIKKIKTSTTTTA